MTRRAVPYRDALRWLMLNDDCSDVFDLEAPSLISWHLVADIYGRTTDDVLGDLRRLIAIERPADVPRVFGKT